MNVAVWAPPMCLWLAVVLRMRQRHGHASRALFIGLLACAAGATINVPTVAGQIDAPVWLPPNVSQLLKHLMVLLAAQQSYEVVRGLSLPEQEAQAHHRLRLTTTAVAAALLTVLFFAGPAGYTQVDNFTQAFAGAPVVAGYWLVFLCALGLSLASIRRIAWSYRSQLESGPLRLGMTLVAVGAVCGLVYVVGKCAYVAARVAGVSATTLAPAEAWTPLPLAAAILTTLAGVLWPRVAARSVVRQLTARYQYLRLYRLWRELTIAAPNVHLQSAVDDGRRSRPVVGAHEGQLLLYRRVVEILDAELALLPYADPSLLHQAVATLPLATPPRQQHRAIARRIALDLALHANRSGQTPTTTASVPPPQSRTLDEDVRALRDVDRARRSARRAVRQLRLRPTRTPETAEESV